MEKLEKQVAPQSCRMPGKKEIAKTTEEEKREEGKGANRIKYRKRGKTGQKHGSRVIAGSITTHYGIKGTVEEGKGLGGGDHPNKESTARPAVCIDRKELHNEKIRQDEMETQGTRNRNVGLDDNDKKKGTGRRNKGDREERIRRVLDKLHKKGKKERKKKELAKAKYGGQ